MSAYLQTHDLAWNSCGGVCTGGAPSITGRVQSCVPFILNKNPNIETTHCFQHREATV